MTLMVINDHHHHRRQQQHYQRVELIKAEGNQCHRHHCNHCHHHRRHIRHHHGQQQRCQRAELIQAEGAHFLLSFSQPYIRPITNISYRQKIYIFNLEINCKDIQKQSKGKKGTMLRNIAT